MSIQLEVINFIVPIRIIEKNYPGGWGQCLSDHKDVIGGRVWYDEHLFRDGAMNSMDIGFLIGKWKELGFHTHKGGTNPVKWIDVCVVEAMSGGPTLPCDWIKVDGDVAYLKSRPKGSVISQENFIAC